MTLHHPELGAVEMPGVPISMSVDHGGTPSRRAGSRPAGTMAKDARRADGQDPDSGGAPLAGVKVLDLGVVIAGAYWPAASSPVSVPTSSRSIGTAGRPVPRRTAPASAHYNRGSATLVLDLKQPAVWRIGDGCNRTWRGEGGRHCRCQSYSFAARGGGGCVPVMIDEPLVKVERGYLAVSVVLR